MFFIMEQGFWPQSSTHQIWTENFLCINQVDRIPPSVCLPVPSVRHYGRSRTYILGFPDGAHGKEPTCQCKRHKRRGFDPWVRGKKMATHLGILAWRIPWTEEAGRLQSYTVTNNQTQLKQLSMQVLLLLLLLQLCLTLCDPTDGSPPGSTISWILQAGTLERVAISFSNAWKWKVKSLSCVLLFATPWTAAYQAPPSMGFSRQEYWSGVPMQALPPKKSPCDPDCSYLGAATSLWFPGSPGEKTNHKINLRNIKYLTYAREICIHLYNPSNGL